MSISVVIVSWNAKAYLLKCLASVVGPPIPATDPAAREARHHRLEVIVVDNASTDGSADAVETLYPDVTLIRNNANLGFAKGNNIGIRASKGDYLFLINSDVVVSPGCFDAMLGYMEGHPDVGVLGPRIVGSNGQVQRSCMAYPTLWNASARALALDALFPRSRLFGGQLLTFWSHDDTREVDVVNGCFWLVRRSAMDQVGLLDERFQMYGEDVDWCRRFHDGGWKVVFYSDAEALHYGGASSARAPVRFYLQMQRANYQYWLKHETRGAAFAFLMISLLHHTVRLVGEAVRYPLMGRGRAVAAHKVTRSVAVVKWIAGRLASPGQPELARPDGSA